MVQGSSVGYSSFPRKRESRAPKSQRLPPVQAGGRLWTPAFALGHAHIWCDNLTHSPIGRFSPAAYGSIKGRVGHWGMSYGDGAGSVWGSSPRKRGRRSSKGWCVRAAHVCVVWLTGNGDRRSSSIAFSPTPK